MQEGEAPEHSGRKLTKMEQGALEVLEELAPSNAPVPVEDWRAAFAEKVTKRRQTFTAARKALIDNEIVVETNGNVTRRLE